MYLLHISSRVWALFVHRLWKAALGHFFLLFSKGEKRLVPFQTGEDKNRKYEAAMFYHQVIKLGSAFQLFFETRSLGVSNVLRRTQCSKRPESRNQLHVGMPVHNFGTFRRASFRQVMWYAVL
jgi:hypothetical protein